MNLRRKSFVLLLIVLFLLFLLLAVEVSRGAYSTDFSQIIGFVLTLIAIFGGAYFELDRFERQLKEERQKEIRQHRLAILDSIESWVDEISTSIEEIDILRELSPKDPQDNKLLVSKDKIRSVEERLLRLDNKWFTVLIRAADLVGIKRDGDQKFEALKEEYQALLTSIYATGSVVTDIRSTLATGNTIPHTKRLTQPVAELRQAIDQIRLAQD